MMATRHPLQPTCGYFRGCRQMKSKDGTYRKVHARRCPAYGWKPPESPTIKEKTPVPQDEWEIEDNGRGSFDVRHNRRPVRFDRETLAEAAEDARRGGAREVVIIDPDGYRHTERVEDVR